MFFDRYDAGGRLAEKLRSHTGTDAVVLALPRGGVLVGYEIAKLLHLPLDIVITRKIGHPFNKEMAMCAVTEDGVRVCNDCGRCGMDDDTWLIHETELAMEEAARRRVAYGQGTSLSLKGKTVILADDGIATGLTMKAALMAVKDRQQAQLIVAVPVGPHSVLEELRREVDEVVVLDEGRDFRGAVGAYYTHFPEVFDREVITCLQHNNVVSQHLFANNKH